MFLLLIFLICLFIAAGVGVMAAWSDIKGMTIPNIHSLIVMASFVVCFLILWLFGRDDVLFSPISHLLSGLFVFGITLVMFSFKAIGAADSKLASAYALWVGLRGLPAFLFYMTVIGGLLGVAALIMKKYKPFKNPPEDSWVAQVQAGESKVPYGVAIVLGALASFVNLGYFSLDVLASFLLS